HNYAFGRPLARYRRVALLLSFRGQSAPRVHANGTVSVRPDVDLLTIIYADEPITVAEIGAECRPGFAFRRPFVMGQAASCVVGGILSNLGNERARGLSGDLQGQNFGACGPVGEARL